MRAGIDEALELGCTDHECPLEAQRAGQPTAPPWQPAPLPHPLALQGPPSLRSATRVRPPPRPGVHRSTTAPGAATRPVIGRISA